MKSEWIKTKDQRLPNYDDLNERLVNVYALGSKRHSEASWRRDGIGLIHHWRPGERGADINGWPIRELGELMTRLDMDECEITMWCPIPIIPEQS